ncbi:MAG: hypothetical protein ACR5LD_01995 [Symbiopectobacterium sp.]
MHMGWRKRLLVLKSLLFIARSRMPEQRLPEVTPNWRKFIEPDNKTRLIWFGHSSLLLNMDVFTLLINPAFSASAAPFLYRIKRFQPPVITMEAVSLYRCNRAFIQPLQSSGPRKHLLAELVQTAA